MQFFANLFFIILISSQALTAEVNKSSRGNDSPKVVGGRKVQKPVQVIEKTRSRLNKGLQRLTTNIDQFFSDEFVDPEYNNSEVRITLQSTAEDYEKPLYNLLLNTYLRLPMTERKFQVFLTSLNDDEDDDINNQDENNYGAGLRFEFLSRKNINLQADTGIVLTDRLDPFIKFRLRNTMEYTHWTSRYIQTLFWFDSRGYDYRSEAFWDRRLNPVLLFRIYSSVLWQEETKLIEFGHNYNLIHRLDDQNAIIYRAGLEGFDQPVIFVENYQMNITLRTLIYKDWLALNLSPGAIWRKEDNFKTRAQFRFALNMWIGSQ
jgi:hypothetical protein